MADKNADQIKALYVELAKLAPSQDWERILKTSKKILGFNVNEQKALHCKVVCLIHLDQFKEALASIKNTDSGAELVFERAYCEYRLHQIEEAYATLTSQNRELDNKEKELLAQVTYRLEKYQESYDTYRDLIKNTDDEFENERQTNLSAVVASLKNTNPSSTKDLDMSEKENQTYELCYNSACIALSKGNEQAAIEKLKKAEKMCIEMFHEDQPQDSNGQVVLEQSDQEALDNELAIIKVQLAYCFQKLGKNDEALKIYNSVIKTKPSDLSVMAVLNNNMVCLNKDQNVFDSKKRLKAATGAELDQKLNSLQLRTISFNEILFSILTNQKDSVSKQLDQYKNKFQDLGRYSLLRVTQLYREKKYADAEQILKEAIKNSSDAFSPSGRISLLSVLRLHLIQVLLAQGKQKESIDVFKSLDEYKAYKLGVISSLVTLLKKHNPAGISDVYSGAVEHFSKVDPNARELQVYVKENSSYQIANNNFQKACEMLEKMRSMRPNDIKILSKLINTYSKFNPAKAKELSKDLPTLEKLAASSNIDIDLLESQFSLMNSKYGKAKTTAGADQTQVKSPGLKSGDKKQEVVQKKKKKRKVILPKNYNPNVQPDPERWIPLRERSYYRGKRKKKNAVGKGTQGAVSYSAKDTPPNMTPQASHSSPKPGEKIPEAESKTASAKPTTSAAAKSAQQKKKKKGGKW